MRYFVKLTTQGRNWGWCYADEVKQTSGVITLRGAHTPAFGGITVPIFQGDYPWAIDNGWLHAYPIRHDLMWQPAQKNAVVYPGFIPESIAAKGFEAAVKYALRGSFLQHVFADEAVRRCVAEDKLIDQETANLRSPVFLPATDDEVMRWAGLRPTAYGHASTDADRIVSESSLAGDMAAARRRLRMEAHRKIDATREQFTATPALASDPYLEIITDHGPVRVGRLKEASYPEGVGARQINPKAQDEACLLAMERAILPGEGDVSVRLEYLPWQEALAAWEELSPHQALPSSCWTETIPSGLKLRQGLHWAPNDLSSIGVFPVISEPAERFLQGRAIEIPNSFACACYCLRRIWRAAP